jgi:Type III restriction enzyme, res subunit/Restriction endonuclease/YgjP-like, metallopeptidase domain
MIARRQEHEYIMPTLTNFRDVDHLSPADFEFFVRDVFAAAGWTDLEVTESGKEFAHGDGGVDIVGTKHGKRFVIEVKQRALGSRVETAALNQLVTGAKLRQISRMILVTNSYFTQEVQVRALRLGVELIDRDCLQDMWIERHSEIGRRIVPRRYQQAVIDEIMTGYRSGKGRFLLEMATGLGKTYTAAHLVRSLMGEADSGELRVLFLAHQVEILLQSVTSFKNVLGVGNRTFSACFNGADPEPTDLVFASFATVFTKLDRLAESTFDVVIVDEAHHAPAQTFATVVRHFEPRLLVGLTATPFRRDGQDVREFFGESDGHVGRYDLKWALKRRYLAFPKYTVLLNDLDQDRIDQLGTGLSVSDLDKRLFLHKKDREVVGIIEEMFVIDYVIVHELAHLLEANHTSRFWNIVRTQAPATEKAKTWLKANGQILEEDV